MASRVENECIYRPVPPIKKATSFVNLHCGTQSTHGPVIPSYAVPFVRPIYSFWVTPRYVQSPKAFSRIAFEKSSHDEILRASIGSFLLAHSTCSDGRMFSVGYGRTAPSVAAVAANLFLVAASRQVAHSHCGPAQPCHYLRQMPVGARCPAALGNLKYVQQCLAAPPLQPVVI